jgi:hypothetical protein
MKKMAHNSDSYVELQMVAACGAAPVDFSESRVHQVRVNTDAFRSGTMYNRFDLLYHANHYGPLLGGWPEGGVDPFAADPKIDLLQDGVIYNNYCRTSVQVSPLILH